MAKAAGPDQARSWAVALSAFVINALLSGISRASGLFYLYLIRDFGASRLQANLPFTLRNVVRHLAGPFVAIIGERYGSCRVTAVGGVLASTGVSLCFFATNMLWICLFWGGLHGFGVALSNTLLQAIINQYFLKHRAFASCLALSGGCVGSFVFPLILKCLLKTEGLQGAFLLTGGFALNVLPAAIFMKKPLWRKDFLCKDKNESPSYLHQGKTVEPEMRSSCFEEQETKSSAHKVQELFPGQKLHSKTREDNQVPIHLESRISKRPDKMLYQRSISSDIIPSSVQMELSTSKEILQLLQSPMFYMIGLSLATTMILFDPSITVVIDYVMDKGLSERAGTYFVITMSLADFFGRLCFGWVTDGGYLSLASFMVLVHVIQGVCFVLLPLFFVFEILMAVLIVYGIAAGATLVIYPVLVAKYLSSAQPLAIGCLSFIGSISALAILPFIGYFRDGTGSYDGMFSIIGGLSVFTGILWILEPFVIKLSHKLERTTDETFFS